MMPAPGASVRPFQFDRDTFAFANELVCEYRFSAGGGPPQMVARHPRPGYVLRCFVLVRAARQFFYHAAFQPDQPPLPETEYRRRIRRLVRRSPRHLCAPDQRISFPGFAGLRAFSQAWEHLLKATCGGAWRSYVLRSHWRMVLPISRQHQARTARRLADRIAQGSPPIVHLLRFPQLSINHGVLLFRAAPEADSTRFDAYDPNAPDHPVPLTYRPATRTFHLPPTRYWAGGGVDVIEIYRHWWF